MLRKGRVLSVFVCFIFFVCCQSGIVFGGPFDMMKSKGGGGGTVSRGDLDNLYKYVADADKLLQDSINISSKILLNKDELQQIEMKQKNIAGIQDPKERESETRKIQEDTIAMTLKASEDADATKKIGNLDEKQKVLYGKSIYNLLLAGLKDKDAVAQANQMMQKIQGNPTAAASFASDVTKLKDIVSTLPSQVKKIVSLGDSLRKIAKSNKIEVAVPNSASDKPQDIDL
ncbi:MAG TPA: hypothetical protein PLA81_01060 [Syntrophorhabdaceae bacterium]|jgi:hypothetical protein|nr:hypothetical protein [Syntrophorhabdaceae bacterium]HOS04868.1 hypothetical protein [Syntrophorhabdaceae bacterium]HPL40165.1 hypothetical protein [Syntrophorhabdaceae bacterium]